MKSVILAGPSRAGKTTLAKRLQREIGLYHIKGDALVGALGDTFPQLNVRHGGDYQTVCEGFAPFAAAYLRRSKNTPLIFDSYFITPDQIIELGLDKEYYVIFLGYPESDPQTKTRQVAEADPQNYGPDIVPHDELLADMVRQIQRSKEYREKCSKYNLAFYDLSHDFHASQDQAFEKIMAELKS